MASRFSEGGGQELLTGATDRCREGIQFTGAAALAGAVPAFTALECSQPCADPREQVTGSVGAVGARPADRELPKRRDGVGMEGVEIAPRPLGQVEAPGEGEQPRDESLGDGAGTRTSTSPLLSMAVITSAASLRDSRPAESESAVTSSARLSTSRRSTTGSHSARR